MSFGALLHFNGTWYGEGGADASATLPRSLLAAANNGHVARQRSSYHGSTALFVAVPLPEPGALYVEVFALADLEHTLQTLAVVTALGAVITTLAGAALGAGASRRVIRPLHDATRAAEDIASGDLALRLGPSRDADLAPLITSFNHMVDALEERVQREARFASDVSHELRTPLTAIRAAIDVLDNRLDGGNARPVFTVLQQECERFDKLVLDLLEISRFDTGNQQLTLETVDPRSVVHATLRNTGHADVPVEVDPNTPSTCELDKRRVERMLANLLANADVHAGGAVRVTITAPDHSIRIAVDDCGPGISNDERDTIFERFHRGKGARRDTGTGLGLALVAEHCRVHGGRLLVENRPAGGATFAIEIPGNA